MSQLLIFKNEIKLSVAERELVIKSMREKYAHTLGWTMPPEISGICIKRKGYYVGHGVCFLQHIITRKDGCVKCRSNEILAQLNWVFQNFSKFSGLSAEWSEEKRKKRKTKKRVDK